VKKAKREKVKQERILKWLLTFGEHDPACPDCGENSVRLFFLGDPESRVGEPIIWCDNCWHGIRGRRAKAPEGVEIHHEKQEIVDFDAIYQRIAFIE